MLVTGIGRPLTCHSTQPHPHHPVTITARRFYYNLSLLYAPLYLCATGSWERIFRDDSLFAEAAILPYMYLSKRHCTVRRAAHSFRMQLKETNSIHVYIMVTLPETQRGREIRGSPTVAYRGRGREENTGFPAGRWRGGARAPFLDSSRTGVLPAHPLRRPTSLLPEHPPLHATLPGLCLRAPLLPRLLARRTASRTNKLARNSIPIPGSRARICAVETGRPTGAYHRRSSLFSRGPSSPSTG